MTILRRLYQRDHLSQVLGTFAILLMSNEAVRMVWGSQPIALNPPAALAGPVELLPGFTYPAYRLFIIGVGLAVALLPAGIPPSRLDLLSALGWAGCGGPPEVDLLVRTGGEHRISDFLLWESAYAEVRIRDVGPEPIGEEDLDEALAWFSRRERRFGGLPSTVSIPAPPSGGANATPVRAA